MNFHVSVKAELLTNGQRRRLATSGEQTVMQHKSLLIGNKFSKNDRVVRARYQSQRHARKTDEAYFISLRHFASENQIVQKVPSWTWNTRQHKHYHNKVTNAFHKTALIIETHSFDMNIRSISVHFNINLCRKVSFHCLFYRTDCKRFILIQNHKRIEFLNLLYIHKTLHDIHFQIVTVYPCRVNIRHFYWNRVGKNPANKWVVRDAEENKLFYNLQKDT